MHPTGTQKKKPRDTEIPTTVRVWRERYLHILISPELLFRVEKTLGVSHLLTFRDFPTVQTRAESLDVHGRQSSRRRGLGIRSNVVGVQAVRGGEPNPAVSHDG
jgi:hypothetical protein